MDRPCVVCTESVPVSTATDFVQCSGPCKQFLHQKCAGLPKSTLKIVNETPNLGLIFHCKTCFIVVKDLRDSLADLKNSIDSLSVRASQSVPATAALPFSAIVAEQEERAAGKRRRVDVHHQSTTPSMPSPWQTVARKSQRRNLCVGSTACDSLKSVEARKSLVASMLHPTTVPADLEQFIKKQLNLAENSDTLRCTPLIPKGKTAADLDFVSFRISAPESTILQLQDAACWPNGVVVREFQPRPRTDRRQGVFIPAASPSRVA